MSYGNLRNATLVRLEVNPAGREVDAQAVPKIQNHPNVYHWHFDNDSLPLDGHLVKLSINI